MEQLKQFCKEGWDKVCLLYTSLPRADAPAINPMATAPSRFVSRVQTGKLPFKGSRLIR